MPLLRTSLCQKECVVKVVRESGKRELFARQITPRERPTVTLRPSCVHTRSNTVSMPRETESNLQAWNSDTNASGSCTWPKEEIEQSIALRIDGIPNDETYKDGPRRKFLKQATVSYMKFSKELTKYIVNIATRTLRLDFKYVHAEDNWTCRKKCSPASDKKLSNSLQMPFDIPRSQTWCSAMPKAPLPSQGVHAKNW